MARGPRFYPAVPGEPGQGLGRGKVLAAQMPSLRRHRDSGSLPPSLPLQINDLRSQKTPIESLFIEATEKFRSNLKTMYSVPVCVAPQPQGGPVNHPAFPRMHLAPPPPSVCPGGHAFCPHRTGRSTSAIRT